MDNDVLSNTHREFSLDSNWKFKTGGPGFFEKHNNSRIGEC